MPGAKLISCPRRANQLVVLVESMYNFNAQAQLCSRFIKIVISEGLCLFLVANRAALPSEF